MDETRMTVALPNLDIQIIHRDSPEENAEIIAVQFRATPSFDAIRGMMGPALLTAANPMAANPMVALWLAPLQVWSGLVRQAWAPWLNVFAPRLTPPQG